MTKILVVDDEAEIRSLLGAILQSRGYHAVTAEDGTAALIWVSTVINAYNRIAISTRMVPPSPAPAG